MYSAKVLDHFEHPRCAGEILQPSVVVEVSNPVCGDVLKLAAVVSDQRVIDVKFKVGGCVPAVACGSWLAEWVDGKAIHSLHPVSASEIELALDGLPPASRHASTLAAEALRQLLGKLK